MGRAQMNVRKQLLVDLDSVIDSSQRELIVSLRKRIKASTSIELVD